MRRIISVIITLFIVTSLLASQTGLTPVFARSNQQQNSTIPISILQSSIIENFDSSANFTQTDPDVNISGGLVNWSVSRNGGQQYVYRSIPSFSGDVRLTVRGRVDSYNNNCTVKAGIGDTPGTGTSINFGFTGGGCSTQGPVVQADGANLDYGEYACNFTGNWLWISLGTFYTATFTLSGANASLSIPGIGTSYGTPTYSGPYDTLYVGLTGDGDWPSCSGKIDSITAEPLSEPANPTSVYLPMVMHRSFTALISETKTTDENGKAIFNLEQGDIEVRLVDQNWGSPVRNIQLQVVSQDDRGYILVMDPEGNFYPQIKEIDLSQLAKESTTLSGSKPIPVLIVIAVVAISAAISIYDFASDPPTIQNAGLGWVETCWTPEDVVDAVAIVSSVGGILKIKALVAEKLLSLILKAGGEIIAADIVTASLEAMWCENQWPSPFKVKYTTANTLFPILMATDNFPLQGCDVQVSTCPAHSGHIYGVVTDATTGSPLDGVEIVFPYRPSIFEATNYTGNYSTYRAPAGYSTVQASLPGYAPEAKVVYLPEDGSAELNFSLSPITDINEVRAVLTWGSSPRDLDSHLWLPDSNPYHIYFSNKGNISAFPWANLDIDDTSGYGPETVTFRIDKVTGKYTLAVYDYTGTGTISSSEATITLYRGDRILRTYKANEASGISSGNWWYIADIEPYPTILGTWDVVITNKNQIQSTSPR